MFVKETRSKGRTYLQIVESYRDHRGNPKHRVILSLGRKENLKEEYVNELTEKLAQLSKGLALIRKGEEFVGKSYLLGSILAIESI